MTRQTVMPEKSGNRKEQESSQDYKQDQITRLISLGPEITYIAVFQYNLLKKDKFPTRI